MNGPDPNTLYPFEDLSYELDNVKRCVFLKNVIKKKNIQVGNYSYYDDPEGPDDFENKNVLYHYPFSPEKLIIGKFVAIATKVRFIMGGANHKLDGFSTYPFGIFGHGWEKKMDVLKEVKSKGDTIVGNDVWFGYGATIMPGVTIGDGVIVGAKSVVTKSVAPYAVVGGNPAKVIRMRFAEDIVKELLAIQWWNWNIEKITANIDAIIHADLGKLKNAQ